MFPTTVTKGLIVAAALASTVQAGTRKHSGNYAGGVTYGDDIVEVSADIIIPTCTGGLPKREYSLYTSNGWVGLSAYSQTGLIQAGITCDVNITGPTQYSAWTEWAPEAPTFYESADFQAGDVVHARVVAYSNSSGTTYLENRRTGERFETSYQNQTNKLGLGDAEWITESQLSFGPLGPEGRLGAKYTPWRFENATYRTRDGPTAPFDSSRDDDHLIDDILKDVQIATAVSNAPASLQVNFTTPDNYTVPGLS